MKTPPPPLPTNARSAAEKYSGTGTGMTKLLLLSLVVLLCFISYNLRFARPYQNINYNNCIQTPLFQSSSAEAEKLSFDEAPPTDLSHVVFGIAASAKLWHRRKSYIKLWYRPETMRGVVWLDKHVRRSRSEERSLPPERISSTTDHLPYNNPTGHRSALRISRIVSETLRMGFPGARWFVMGDDDTVFVAENLIRVLRKYDHNQFYYIGAHSESHLQNINFSYGMAYGGGGFAISAPLAAELAKMQDRCIERYPKLYGSDDRIQACMAELGVPLTREAGFHQFDVYGSVFGLLAAHPVTPLVSLHHLDIVQPIFPKLDRVKSLKRLSGPMNLDSAGLMQQSICYDPVRNWTISVSWGYAVQIFRGILTAREVEIPGRTFLNWYKRSDFTAHAFNTRPYSRNTCQRPFIYYLYDARFDPDANRTVSDHYLGGEIDPECDWNIELPSWIQSIHVLKKPDPDIWSKAPRRNCCRVLPEDDRRTMVIDVGVCNEDEIVAL